ncbi:EAL domain-containing protein [Paenibacillus sp. GD4]|uniref:putative bifunctional diguanylate cyclase/phosphodiesterase n=1 Tax=Paenibacillus sp. GD4 TaxID=3068890 RepID=UPI002796586E|nr:EAL domain-containing protein [Paenibacillus sp. GD4]MDQ1910310.1 EAL domain-containing protein [Paenibacillus sp. GD4]
MSKKTRATFVDTWQHSPPERPQFLCLLTVLISTELIFLLFRHMIGQPGDRLDYLVSAVIALLLSGVLMIGAKHGSSRGIRYIPFLVLIFVGMAGAEMALRLNGGMGGVSRGDWLEASARLLITVPLLYFLFSVLRQREITEQKLHYLSQHDQLTGLPNRSMFQSMVQKAISQAKQDDSMLGVMFIDLDRFKNINDTFGHEIGDQLLMEAAERLRQGLHSTDWISRQGGDEFTVVAVELTHEEDAEKVARKIIDLLSRPFRIEGHELRIGCSIGISLYPSDGEDAVTLMKNADTAMYRVKEQGKNHYIRYKPEMNDSVIRKLVLEEWLNKALDQEEFMVYYQPQVDIDVGGINGMEALLRWNHPGVGYISPAEFIPLAEETGLIVPIGKWVLRTACQQNKAWQRAGYEPLKIAVNISPIQFYQQDFVQVVVDALRESELDPQYLELEITEGVAMYQVDQVIEKLNELRTLGVQISIDDFGTGYSSLTYLKKFPIQKLKIAQQFVRDVTFDADDAAIVQAIMALAHSLKLKVIAEGVETEEQLQFLTGMRCKEVQGYIYSRPIPAQEFTALMERRSA